MKNTTKAQRSRKLLSAALSGLLLAVGCTCVTVQINLSSPTQSSGNVHRIGGGNFAPLYGSIVSGTGTQPIPCDGGAVTVQKSYADLKLPVTGQTPGPGENGFVGHLIKSNTITHVVTDIANTDYLLRATYNLSTYSCCTNVPNDPLFVGCTNTPGLYYKFKAYWRPNATVPTANDRVYLLGAWVQQ